MLPRLTCGAEGVHHLRFSRVVVGDQSELSLGVFLLYLHDVLGTPRAGSHTADDITDVRLKTGLHKQVIFTALVRHCQTGGDITDVMRKTGWHKDGTVQGKSFVANNKLQSLRIRVLYTARYPLLD